MRFSELPTGTVGFALLSKAVVVPSSLSGLALACRFGGRLGGFSTEGPAVFASPTLAIAFSAGSAGGLTYAGIVPATVRIVAPGPP